MNARWAEILGYSLAELAPVTIETWRSRLHPDDALMLTQLLEHYLSGLEPKYECTSRMRHQQGHWVWVHSHGQRTNLGPNNAALQLYGSHMDITAE